MIDPSRRLMTVLRGGEVTRPPLWEPYFAMNRLIADRFGGDCLAAIEHLDHAAVQVGVARLSLDIFEPDRPLNEHAVHRAMKQADEPDPYWEVQVRDMTSGRRAIADAGRASFVTLKWCFTALANAMNFEDFALLCHDEPDLLGEVMGYVERRNRAAIEHLLSAVQPDFVLFDGDCAHPTGLLIAPSMMQRLCAEPTRQTVAALAEQGMPAAFHTDGKLDDLIPMLVDWGFACVHGCERVANDLEHLVGTFGDRIALAGNMDVVKLAQSDPDAIRLDTQRMLQTGAECGRFIASCNTVVEDVIPADNYLAYAETVREFEPA